jgi:hypothetical protein
VGDDRFDADLEGHVESLPLSLIAGLSSLRLGRRTFPLAGSAEGTDLTADAVVGPEGDDPSVFEEPVTAVPLPETDNAFDVDDRLGSNVSVRVEDSLEEGEPEEGVLACCDISEEVRERLGRGSFGKGSVGGGEFVPDATRLGWFDGGAAAVDGDFNKFGGDVAASADDDRVAVIDWAEAPAVVNVGACKLELEPTCDAALAVVRVRESEAARARNLDGTYSIA